MQCYVLVYVHAGLVEVVTAYPLNPQGLMDAKEAARGIIVEDYNGNEDSLGLYQQDGNDTGMDILTAEEMKQWLIDAGKTEEARWYF